jgi:hypothetical protein
MMVFKGEIECFSNFDEFGVANVGAMQHNRCGRMI